MKSSPENTDGPRVSTSARDTVTINGLGPIDAPLKIVLKPVSRFEKARLERDVLIEAPQPKPLSYIRRRIIAVVEEGTLVAEDDRARAVDLLERYYAGEDLAADAPEGGDSVPEDDDQPEPLTDFEHGEVQQLIARVTKEEVEIRELLSDFSFFLNMRGLLALQYTLARVSDKAGNWDLDRRQGKASDEAMERLIDAVGDAAFAGLQLRASHMVYMPRALAKNSEGPSKSASSGKSSTPSKTGSSKKAASSATAGDTQT